MQNQPINVQRRVSGRGGRLPMLQGESQGPALEPVGSMFLSIYGLLSPYCRFGFLEKFVRVGLAGFILLATWTVAMLAKSKSKVKSV